MFNELMKISIIYYNVLSNVATKNDLKINLKTESLNEANTN